MQRSTLALLQRIVRHEDKRDQRSRKLDWPAAEIGKAQPAHHRFRCLAGGLHCERSAHAGLKHFSPHAAEEKVLV
jgi:hypothetical protein